jgi:Zn finger protein HypA/HybF involved in hydrogenase expression
VSLPSTRFLANLLEMDGDKRTVLRPSQDSSIHLKTPIFSKWGLGGGKMIKGENKIIEVKCNGCGISFKVWLYEYQNSQCPKCGNRILQVKNGPEVITK